MELDPSNFSGTILLNLDTEDDDELSIGCAGGIDTNTSYAYEQVSVKDDFSCRQITVKGLVGGHSGMDIDKGRGNANKLMNRILHHLQSSMYFQLVSVDGGSLRNAIPRESNAIVAIHPDFIGQLELEFSKVATEIKTEFKSIEKELHLSFDQTSTADKAVSDEDKKRIINAVYACHNGVFRLSPDIEGLVETSSSLARVIVRDGEFITQSLLRSSVESTKGDIANTLRATCESVGCDVVQEGDYPGWQPNADSAILNVMTDLYRTKFKEEPQVKACHAGLECGILLQHLPKVDMISFGPNIRAAHSPDEKVQISSVQKFWDYLLDALKLIPAKG
jgi:dipeptidase D